MPALIKRMLTRKLIEREIKRKKVTVDKLPETVETGCIEVDDTVTEEMLENLKVTD